MSNDETPFAPDMPQDPPATLCADCGNPDANWGPCPYAYDLHGDDTPVCLCSECAKLRAHEV